MRRDSKYQDNFLNYIFKDQTIIDAKLLMQEDERS